MTKVVAILGATGTGKTAAGVALCKALGGAVVNFDARQIYNQLPIVTAQPAAEETDGVEHLLYGFLDPCAKLSAGQFADVAHDAISEVAARAKIPVLVGGTGMYLDAILRPFAAIPPTPPQTRSAISERIATEGPETLHAELAAVDPAYAAKIHPRDKQRICRALEVHHVTGRTLTEWHDVPTPAPRYHALKFGLAMERSELVERLERRIDLMLDAGALEEVRHAFSDCALAPNTVGGAASSIGCAELLGVLAGQSALDEAKTVWLKRTKDYAKRQMTWFRRDPDVVWLAPQDTDRMVSLAKSFLESSTAL